MTADRDLSVDPIGERDDDGFLVHLKDIREWLERVNWGGLASLGCDVTLMAGKEGVDVRGDIYIIGSRFDRLPVRFGTVHGAFSLTGGRLSSTDGLPRVVYGNLDLSRNALESLVGGVQTVCGYGVILRDNRLTHLDGLPDFDGSLDVSGNRLTTLDGCPKNIPGRLNASNNQLTRLPELNRIGTELDLRWNPILAKHLHLPDVGGFVFLPAAPLKHGRQRVFWPPIQKLLDDGHAHISPSGLEIKPGYAAEALDLTRLWLIGAQRKKKATVKRSL